MRKQERLIENLGAADIKLSDDEFKELESRLEKITIHGNRTCKITLYAVNIIQKEH